MLMKYTMRMALLVCVVVLLVQVPAPALAQSGGPGQAHPPVVLGTEDAYREDANAYVAAFGGTIDEAIRHLKLQGIINDLDATLQVKESGTFAGLWIEHTPRFRVVAQFTRGGKEVVLPYIPKGLPADLVDVQTAPISLKELKAIHARVIRYIQATGIPSESDIDLQANSIKVYVTNRQQLKTALSTSAYQLPANVQVVEVAQLSRPMSANWFAGMPLDACTSGFSLWNVIYVRYSSTAGHCTGYQSPLSMPFFTRVGGPDDFEVNRAPVGWTVKNWAADRSTDSTPYYREITSWWAGAAVGDLVCKTGKTTGYTCGIVVSSNYSYHNSPTWILIKSTNPKVLIACGGDSGGPVYIGSTAVAEAVSGWCDLNNNYFIAMPVRRYREYGYNVMIMP